MNETNVEEESSVAALENSRFWIQRVLVPIIVCIGITGNTITVMVLTRRRMRSSTNIYLSSLAIADIIYLFFSFMLSLVHYESMHNGYGLYWRFVGISHWLVDAAGGTSVWITVSFTVERYIAVCHPMKGKYFCTENRAKTATALVYILCILTTASTAFEYQLSINNTCIRECTLEESKKLSNLESLTNTFNNSNIHFVPHRIVLSQTNLNPRENESDKFNSIVTVYNDPNLTMTLKNILSKCTTSHAHIIYVYPQIFNGTNENKFVENNANVEKVPNMTVVHQYLNDTTNNISNLESRNVELRNNNHMNENETDLNQTKCCKIDGRINTESTDLANNPTYITFIQWYSAIMNVVLPLMLIATFNSFLIHAVYKSQTQRKVMTNSNQQNQSQESISMSNENRITLMLIAVVVTFLIFQLPQAIHLIYYNLFPSFKGRSANIRLILGNVFNFFVMINSSCNFLLYSVMSKKFRGTFKKIFCQREKKNSRQDTIQMSTTKSRNSQKFNPYKHGLMRKNQSEYRTPRNLETQSLTGVPRSKSLMVRAVGKARSTDLIV